jgi:hypothetical protein
MLCTKVTLSQDEFNDFKVADSAKLTFCLKELRAISSFCDYTNQVRSPPVSPPQPSTLSVVSTDTSAS